MRSNGAIPPVDDDSSGLELGAVAELQRKAVVVAGKASDSAGVEIGDAVTLDPAAVVDKAPQRDGVTERFTGVGHVAGQSERTVRFHDVGCTHVRTQPHASGHAPPNGHRLAKRVRGDPRSAKMDRGRQAMRSRADNRYFYVLAHFLPPVVSLTKLIA